MLLQQLKLKNIRSYFDQTITFPSGSTLLSGDIGSGKSTILLAIEFALFGTARPDLPGEALLRKGTTQGSVELSFQLHDQCITIYRALKKEKDAIKQLPGYIIINNVKKDLMPIELKAEILQLLGYPEDYLTKNKNYIFRYTVYTPQEEMKLILQDDLEFRLDSLRKIFNVDKYKIIRENVEFYLKQLRAQIRQFELQTEPLESLKRQAQALQEEQEKETRSLQQATTLLKELQEHLQQQKQQLEVWEREQQHVRQWQQQQQMYSAVLAEKITQRRSILEKQEQLRIEIAQLLLPDTSLEKIKEEAAFWEEKRMVLLQKKSKLQERRAQLQKLSKETLPEAGSLQQEIALIPEKELLFRQLQQQSGQRPLLERKKQQMDELLHKTNESITRNETLLQQAQDVEQNIVTFDQCPTCLQPVSPEHKHRVQEEEQRKIRQAEELLFEFKKKREEIRQQHDNVHHEIIRAIQQENLLTRTTLELEQLREKKQRLQGKEDQLQSWAEEQESLQREVNSLETLEGKEQHTVKLKRLTELLQQFTRKQAWEQQLQDLGKQLAQHQLQVQELQQNVQEVEEKLSEVKDLSAPISDKKNIVSQLQEQEKAFSVRQAQLQARIEARQQQEQHFQQQIQQLTEIKNKVVRQKELHHWLEEHFLKLTYTMERQIMLSIHYLFSQLFQEWFSLLIDDETVTSRLDDSFTPVIEQNGYEIAFTNLSGGERTSAALAYRLALNKVINDVIQDIKTKDLLILDEPTDGFSSEQLDKVREVLERLNLNQTIIVSHESKIESFVENVVRIRKEGQVSGVSE